MPSPFPGMDPYLEGYLWPDVHTALAHKIRQLLAPQIQPKYVARLEISVIEDESFEAEVGVMYPDVEIVEAEPTPEAVGGVMVAEPAAATAPLTIPVPQVRLVSVEIRDVAENELVTSIEIISPVNKREPNLSRYRQKRERIRNSDVHLLEIDLVRRGSRVWEYSRIPDVPYVVILTRAAASTMEVWPIELSDALPSLPVPLRPPDKDVVLDLSAALTTVYDEAYYQLSIDYQQDPPPPAFSVGEQAWMRQLLSTEIEE
ncbi:MAG: hypothetical protein MAG451_00196 [Anaerolineales bacterium]|nr:hypothetical protein [Anaerolineales bacterium]